MSLLSGEHGSTENVFVRVLMPRAVKVWSAKIAEIVEDALAVQETIPAEIYAK